MEKLKFSVFLSGTFWDKKPQYSILVNDTVVSAGVIENPDVKEISFEQELADGAHTLGIRLENKTSNDTRLKDGEIVSDMLLNINDIVIDDVSLGQLLWDAEYLLDSPQVYNGETVTKLTHCVNLGWNGTYTLKFSTPFYIWLLEQL